MSKINIVLDQLTRFTAYKKGYKLKHGGVIRIRYQFSPPPVRRSTIPAKILGKFLLWPPLWLSAVSIFL
jgi:hypothetical protein